jgi:hypothetical protein
MIEQYLSNNNEKRYGVILPNFSDLNAALDRGSSAVLPTLKTLSVSRVS